MLFRRLALGFALLCGTLASQVPEFAQQYRQRLGGALDELTAIVEQFTADATAAGLDQTSAIARLESNADQVARDRGRAIRETLARQQRLADQSARFRDSGAFARLGAFARDFDPQIASRAWTNFEPAAPITTEGLVCAGAGAVFGYGFLRLLGAPFSRRRRRPATA